MSFNIVYFVTDFLNDQLKNKIADATSSDITLTQSALDGAIPGLLNSFQELSSKPSSAGTLFSAISNQNGAVLNKLDELLSPSNQAQFANASTKIMTSTLNNATADNLVGAISNYSGLGKGSSTSLLGMLTPITLGLIKRKLLDSGDFSATNLTHLLNGQETNIKTALPDDFSSLLAIDPKRVIHHGAQQNAQPYKKPSFWLTKVLPLLLFAGAFYLIANFLTGQKNEPENTAESTSLTQVQPPKLQQDTGTQGTPIATIQNTTQDTTQATTDENIQPPLAKPQEVITQDVEAQKVETQRPQTKEALDEMVLSLQSELHDSLRHIGNAIGEIKDANTAEAAVKIISKTTARIDELISTAKALPEPARENLAKLITANIPRLQALTKNATELPDVGDIIKPSIQELSASLTHFL